MDHIKVNFRDQDSYSAKFDVGKRNIVNLCKHYIQFLDRFCYPGLIF